MDVTTITNYLVDGGEFVEQEHIDTIKKLLASDNDKEAALKNYFAQEFPDIDATAFFAKYYNEKPFEGKVSILKSFEKTPKKRVVQDFVKHFTHRFKFMENLLRNRSELQGLSSIARIKGKQDKEKVSCIAMVMEASDTKNGHRILTVEDMSGTIKVLINKDSPLLEESKEILIDDIIGITGTAGGDIIFSDSIIYPDVPLSKELKKSPYDNYAVFFSDIEFGSKEFLKREFQRLILWLNGKMGTLEQRKVAKKVKYVVITGDVVDGAGIYPGQEDDLEIPDVKKQYEQAAYYLSKIPKHIKIIVCAGNHDVGRIAEPQLPLPKDYAQSLWDLDNVIMVSNPAYLLLDKTEDFPGILLLMYHGGSLPWYADNIPRIRAAGGQKCADDIMIALLKRRHMAPAHGSYLYVPDPDEDALIIDPIPDIFVTGHIHRAQTKNYRNVTCINSSCWTAITENQEKRGLEPQPGRAFVVSLKTREVKMLNFSLVKDTKTVAEYRRAKAELEERYAKKKEA